MQANDKTDLQFQKLQSTLNDNNLAPCTRPIPAGEDAATCSCIQQAHQKKGFFYGMPAVKVASKLLCPSCMASWLVAVARNLMLGL